MVPGARVEGRFELEREAGSGGMGTVWRARDLHAGGVVALKLMSAECDAQRFVREAEVLRLLTHPGIVSYIAHGVAAAGPYLAMEWLEGESLADRLRREPLAAREAVDLVARAAAALGAAHAKGVLHRDLKPSNLFLVDGAPERVKVIDFGVAHLTRAGHALTRTGSVVGTPEYMAPEQARGDRGQGPSVDVYALGCVLFECLVGRPPFTGEHFMAVLVKMTLEAAPRLIDRIPDAPLDLDDLVARLLAKDPAMRPADGRAVADALGALGGVDELRVVPATERPPALTTAEQRVVTILLVAARGADKDARTLDQSAAEVELADLRVATVAAGGRFEPMADGSAAVLFAGASIVDQVDRAARCALAIRGLRRDAAIALATGRARVAGRLPLGEVVDRGVALLRAGDGTGGVVLDDATARLLGGRYLVARDGDACRLVGEREADHPAVRASPLVGRETELTFLTSTFATCAGEPEAAVVLVTGAAGMGKTRLVAEAVSRMPAAAVWRGRGDPLASASAFAMLAHAIRDVAGVLSGAPLEERRRKLVSRIGRHMAEDDALRIARFVGEIVDAPFSDDDSQELRAARQDAMLMGDRMRLAIEDWLDAETAVGPLVLVLEDLHQGDPLSVRAVDGMLRRLADRPLLVVATARPEVRDVFASLWTERGLQELALGPLKRKASERLVRAALGTPTGDAVARIVERAEGNPFCLEELTRAVAEGRGQDLPETVLAMAQARLEALEPEGRRVMRAASVFGGIFWEGGVAALLGGPAVAPDVRAWLATLAQRGLVDRRASSRFAGEVEHAFVQGLVREAAYAMLTEEDRPLAHRLAAQWLEGGGEGDPLVLAEHFARGGAPSRAVGHYVRAAEQALQGNDFAGAVDLAERSIRCGAAGATLGRMRALQAEAYRWNGDNAGARAASALAMAHLTPGSGTWFGAALDRVFALVRLGEWTGIEETVAAVADELERGDADGLTSAAHVAAVLMVGSRRDLGAPLLARVRVLAAPRFDTDPVLRARVRDGEAILALSNGDFGAYVELVSQLGADWQAAGNLRCRCGAEVQLGYALGHVGDDAAALAPLRRALATAEQLALPGVMASAQHYLGYALMRLGSAEEGLALQLEAAETYASQRNVRMESACHIGAAVALLELGDVVEAETHARRALELAPSASLRVDALDRLAMILLRSGRAEEGLRHAREATALLDAHDGLAWLESQTRCVLAEALEATGDRPGAVAAIRVARDGLLEHAANIADATRRESYLRRVADNRRILELAASWTAADG